MLPDGQVATLIEAAQLSVWRVGADLKGIGDWWATLARCGTTATTCPTGNTPFFVIPAHAVRTQGATATATLLQVLCVGGSQAAFGGEEQGLDNAQLWWVSRGYTTGPQCV